MEVEFGYRGVEFQIGNHSLSVEFKAFGGFDVYLDHMWVPVGTSTLKKIINEGRTDILEKLRKLAEDFKDPRTRTKYYRAYLEGDFRKSKDLTKELRTRAAYRGRHAFGFEIEEPRGWLFVGSEGHGEWRLLFISADLQTVKTRREEGVLAKRIALKILDGEGAVIRGWYGGSPTTVDGWILRVIVKNAEKWKIPKLKELLGVMMIIRGGSQ